VAKKKEAAKKKLAEAIEAGEAEAGDEVDSMEVHAEDIDVFSIEDVTDIGSGEPLFATFTYEDWTLLSLRMEFHCLLHAWKKDLNDPERPSFKENHFPFYYSKYFKKQFDLKLYGYEKLESFMDLVKEAATINATSGLFEAQLEEDLPFDDFLKFTEEHRRDRQRRLDAGDESAEIKFKRPAPANPPGQPKQPKQPPARPASVAARVPNAASTVVKRPISSVARPATPVTGAKVARVTIPQPSGRVGIVQRSPAAPRPAYPVSAYGAPASYGVVQRGYGAPAYAAPTRIGAAPSGYGVRPVYGAGVYRR
jgi:hypothetical protein